jgi:hypothetical protein
VWWDLQKELRFFSRPSRHEAWMYGYDSGKNKTVFSVEIPIFVARKPRQIFPSLKGMLIAFFGIHEIVHRELAPQDEV